MDIRQDIEKFLQASGWTAYRLSKASGVNINVIRRVQLGKRTGVNSSTISKLAPFLYPSLVPVPRTSRNESLSETALQEA